ncbi:MAG TPA: hypothetical protein VNT75_23530 [Symbiobacteriaceae bacterium]|nr:hypothetical protein [Symbiobacteriaceae bacterium]
MLEQLSLPVFTEHLNTTFRAVPEPGHAVDLVLVQAQDKGSTTRIEQFSVMFRGPLHTFLPQRLYALEHAVLGSFELFLVPVGKDEDGFRYQAVFNRFRQ